MSRVVLTVLETIVFLVVAVDLAVRVNVSVLVLFFRWGERAHASGVVPVALSTVARLSITSCAIRIRLVLIVRLWLIGNLWLLNWNRWACA